MAKSKKRESLIPKSAADSKKTNYISKEVAILNNQIKVMTDNKLDNNNAHVLLSIKYLQHDFQCFSEWSKADMKEFWDFNKKIHEYTWKDLHSTAGAPGSKTGLGYTIINSSNYPNSDFKKNLSRDITLFELRISEKARAHGFRLNWIFYLCWLDRDHQICK